MSDPAPLLETARNDALPAAERIAALEALREHPPTEFLVTGIAAVAGAEGLLPVREAALEVLRTLCPTDPAAVTRHVTVLLEIVASDAVPRLRQAAGRDLLAAARTVSGLAPFFVAALEAELDPVLSRGWLLAIARSAPLAAAELAVLTRYAARCPVGLRGDLFAVFAAEGGRDVAAGVVELLAPFEAPELKAEVLAYLEVCPRLPERAAARLVAFAEEERDPAFRAAAVAIVVARATVSPEVLERILALVPATPGGEAWLAELRPRLPAAPGLRARLAAVLAVGARLPLRLAALRLVDPATSPTELLAALDDPSASVRRAALASFAATPVDPDPALVARLSAAAAGEADAELAGAIGAKLVAVAERLGTFEAALFEWARAERRSEVSMRLDAVLLRAARDGGRRAEVSALLVERLHRGTSIARLAPLLEAILGAGGEVDPPIRVELLRRVAASSDFDDASAASELLGLAGVDPLRAAEARWAMFVRFAHRHPEAPLPDFVREFKHLAGRSPAFLARLPQIARMTGEAWILEGVVDAASSSSLLRTIIDALRGHGGERVACDLLRSAYERRTLERSALVALFGRVVHGTEDGLLQEVLRILGDGKLVTEEVVEIALGALRRDPGGRFASQLGSFLANFGPRWPGFRARVLAEVTPERYAEFCRLSMAPTDLAAPPRHWTAWEYEGFRLLFRGWPILALVSAAGADDDLVALLTTPPEPGGSELESLPLAILDHRRRELPKPPRDASGAAPPLRDLLTAELRVLATLLAETRGPERFPVVHDRALCRFVILWRAFGEALRGASPPQDLADAAALAYRDLCALHPTLRGPVDPGFPPPLPGMSSELVRATWVLEAAAFEDLHLDHLATASKDDEARAAALLADLQSAIDAQEHGTAFTLVATLLRDFRPTKTVRRAHAGLRTLRARLEPR